MRIRYLSDLHIDFQPFKIVFGGEDVLVIAGDTSEFRLREAVVKMIFDYLDTCNSQVVFITGNHDYYGADPPTVDYFWCNVNINRLHILNGNSVLIKVGDETVRFIGATLWTDFQRGTPEIMKICGTLYNDYGYIHTDCTKNRLFRPADAAAIHYQHRELIRGILERAIDDKIKNVVVSHHLPSYGCIAEKYAGDVGNANYAATDMDQVMDLGVDLWIHGHTHTTSDKAIRGVRVVCNPRGYPGENKDFVEVNIVDV